MAGNDVVSTTQTGTTVTRSVRSRLLRHVPLPVALLTSALLLAACSSSESGTTTTAIVVAPTSTTTTSVPPSTTTTAPAVSLSLAIEPADRYASVYQMILGARLSLELTMYELADPMVESMLAAAQHRGVAVRVLLDRAWPGAAVNQGAYAFLSAQNVPVRWAPSSVVYHQMTVTADHTVSAIMTGNLTSSSYPTTRDFVVFDRSPAAVKSITTVFDRDWNAVPTMRAQPVAGLVWSPGARTALVGFISSARHTLAVENQAMGTPAILGALKVASRRGVLVTVTMTYNPEWIPAWTSLVRYGVRVATYPSTPTALSIHANAMVADGLTAFAGSQNFSSDSLAHSRELGLTTTESGVVGPLSQTLASDFAGGTRFGVQPVPASPFTTTTAAAPPSTSRPAAPA